MPLVSNFMLKSFLFFFSFSIFSSSLFSMEKERDKFPNYIVKYNWDQLGNSYEQAKLNIENMCNDLGEEPSKIPTKLFPKENLDSVIKKYKALAFDCKKAIKLQTGQQQPFLEMEEKILLKLQDLGYGYNKIIKINGKLISCMKSLLEKNKLPLSITIGCKATTKELHHCSKNYPYITENKKVLENDFIKNHLLYLDKDVYVQDNFFSVTLHDDPEAGADLTFNFYDQSFLKIFETHLGKTNNFKLIILEKFTLEHFMNPETWRILRKLSADGALIIINNYNYMGCRKQTELPRGNEEGIFGPFHSVLPLLETSNISVEIANNKNILKHEKSKNIRDQKNKVKKYKNQIVENKKQFLYVAPGEEDSKGIRGAMQWMKKDHEISLIGKRLPALKQFVSRFGFSPSVVLDKDEKFVFHKTRMPLSDSNQYDLVFSFNEKKYLFYCLYDNKVCSNIMRKAQELIKNHEKNEYKVLKQLFESMSKDQSDNNFKNFAHQVLFRDILRQELAVVDKDLGINVLDEYSNAELWPILTNVLMNSKDEVLSHLLK